MEPIARRRTTPRAPPRPARVLVLAAAEEEAVMVVMTAEETTVGGSMAQGVPQQVRLLRPLGKRTDGLVGLGSDMRKKRRDTYQQ